MKKIKINEQNTGSIKTKSKQSFISVVDPDLFKVWGGSALTL